MQALLSPSPPVVFAMPIRGVPGMACPQEPFPAGWKVWRGPVPPELTQWAMSIRDHINAYPYGEIVGTMDYAGQTVAAFKSHHTWTYRNGQLLTGICIPGVSLLVASTSSTDASAQGSPQGPDPELASFAADEPIRWGEMLLGALAGGLFAHWLDRLHEAHRRRRGRE